MTVRENMGFALKFAGVPKAEIEKQVQEAAKILELQPLLERRPKELSGGQRQRVAIGRAIVRHPQVFLFDEPLSNLDAELRVHMRIEIAKLHKELQTTIIYVTHDQVEAMTLADKIVVLRGGEIAQVGTPLKLYDDPDNLFVAGFIGSPKMNFLKGQLENGRVVLPEYGNISFPASVSASAPQEVTVGIRPDAFDAGGSEQLPLKVEIVEHLGNETYAYGRLGSGELLTIATDNDRQVKPGDDFVARFNPSSLLLFSEDGQRIR
jgi:lactose/L-arabinose transport system ATP-binding protein